MADLVKALRAGMKLQQPDNQLTADIMGDAADHIEQLENALIGISVVTFNARSIRDPERLVAALTDITNLAADPLVPNP